MSYLFANSKEKFSRDKAHMEVIPELSSKPTLSVTLNGGKINNLHCFQVESTMVMLHQGLTGPSSFSLHSEEWRQGMCPRHDRHASSTNLDESQQQ